jgi:hypothetical protein
MTSQLAQDRAVEHEFTAEDVSKFYLELERLLERIERSVTYYQVLGIERSAIHKDIRLAYQLALAVLYPSYEISSTVPVQMLGRIDQAFGKASRAFSVLANFARRKEYDGAVFSSTSSLSLDALKVDALKPPQTDDARGQSHGNTARLEPGAQPRASESVNIKHLPKQREVYTEFAKTSTGDNRRRCERLKLSLPARATGYDRKNGKWQEMTETVDVSRTGVTVRLRRCVRHGTVLYLTLPLPVKLRAHGYADSSYNVYALVRRVEPPKKGVRVVGLEFLGEHPPSGFLEKPWATFRTQRWTGTERRRTPRVDRSEVVVVEYFTEAMQSLAREETRSENLGRNGLRVLVNEVPMDFDLVRVTCPRNGFESLAAVRNRYMGKDGIERLCLQFVDKELLL